MSRRSGSGLISSAIIIVHFFQGTWRQQETTVRDGQRESEEEPEEDITA